MDYIQTLARQFVKTPADPGNSRFPRPFARTLEIGIAQRGHLYVLQLLQRPQMVLADIARPYQSHAESLGHFLFRGSGWLQLAGERCNRILAPPDGIDGLIHLPARYVEKPPAAQRALGFDCL